MEDATRLTGNAIEVRNLDLLDPLTCSRAKDQIRVHSAQLVALLSSCSSSAAAIRQGAAAGAMYEARRRMRVHRVSTLAWV